MLVHLLKNIQQLTGCRVYGNFVVNVALKGLLKLTLGVKKHQVFGGQCRDGFWLCARLAVLLYPFVVLKLLKIQTLRRVFGQHSSDQRLCFIRNCFPFGPVEIYLVIYNSPAKLKIVGGLERMGPRKYQIH